MEAPENFVKAILLPGFGEYTASPSSSQLLADKNDTRRTSSLGGCCSNDFASLGVRNFAKAILLPGFDEHTASYSSQLLADKNDTRRTSSVGGRCFLEAPEFTAPIGVPLLSTRRWRGSRAAAIR